MHGSNQTSPSNRSTARFMAIAGVQLALLLALLYYYLPASKVSVVPSQAVALGAVRMLATDRTAIYHLYALDANGGADDNAVPGESQATGVVVDAWRADTDVNRRACLSLWLFDRAHELAAPAGLLLAEVAIDVFVHFLHQRTFFEIFVRIEIRFTSICMPRSVFSCDMIPPSPRPGSPCQSKRASNSGAVDCSERFTCRALLL